VSSPYKRHFFVCQTQRPEGSEKPSCGQRGAAQIYSRLLEALERHPELGQEVAVSACGCLGLCFDGPIIVVYPEGTWYARIEEADVPEIIEQHLVHGKPVERLRFKWQTAS
jgi:(2Fe-2S) ferredoxin